MRRRSITISIGLIAVCAFFAGRLVSQSKDDEKKEMDAFKAYMTPGKEHKMLEKRAGKWEYVARMFMAPGAPPVESKGKVDRKMIMGGRYLVDDMSGEAMPGFGDQPFQGMGVMGFDNFKKKFVGSWFDNMSTGIMVSEGVVSADGKELVCTMEEPDLMGTTGKPTRKVRTVEKLLSDDHMTFEMFAPGPDGKETKSFEVDYKRKK